MDHRLHIYTYIGLCLNLALSSQHVDHCTRRLPHGEHGLLTIPVDLSSTSMYCVVRVTQYLALRVL